MKKTGLIVLLLAVTAAFAQSGATPDKSSSSQNIVDTNASIPTIQIMTPTYADLYCAGFLSKQLVPNANYITGGLQTPNTTKFVRGDIVYLAGSGYQAGQQYEIVRELRDVNEFQMYPGQASLIKATGQAYGELGRVKILDTRQHNAVATVEYSCDTILPGDIAIPFAEKPTVSFHAPVKFDRFAPPSGRLQGRIVMAKDFDGILGTGAKVYMNVGANQGVKIGDYFRAVRAYTADQRDPVDSLSFKSSIAEDTQKKPPSWGHHFYEKHGGPEISIADMPRRAVGEVVIIGITPTTATGMITSAVEDGHIGDGIELEEQQ